MIAVFRVLSENRVDDAFAVPDTAKTRTCVASLTVAVEELSTM